MALILIIEDYRDTRDVTELILTDAGHNVLNARDGLQGVQLATQAQPDLVLMDLALPVLDGWEATRRLKADATTQHIPVVAFTAQVNEDAVAQAWAAGCSDVITKPFEIECLLDHIAAVLAQSRPSGRQRALGKG
jgi:two-component system cell cycle response regulator DivK